jgi:hypothetical protein
MRAREINQGHAFLQECADLVLAMRELSKSRRVTPAKTDVNALGAKEASGNPYIDLGASE